MSECNIYEFGVSGRFVELVSTTETQSMLTLGALAVFDFVPFSKT